MEKLPEEKRKENVLKFIPHDAEKDVKDILMADIDKYRVLK